MEPRWSEPVLCLGSSSGTLRAGMQPLLQYIDSHYKHPIIYITENGCDVPGESQMELQEALNDTFRINYYQVSAAWKCIFGG